MTTKETLAQTLPRLPAESERGYVVSLGNSRAKIPNRTKSIKKAATHKGRMVPIHPDGRIIDPKYAWRGVTDLYGLLKETPLQTPNKALLERFLRDAELGKTIKGRAKKKIGALRLLKYLQDLKKLDAYFEKALDKVTQEDMERFITDLEKGRYTQKNGKPYAEETQVCMKKIIMKFYRWLGKPDLVEWFDTSYELKDYRAISKEQLDYLLESMTSNSPANLARNRALLAFLFDTGARADEVLNVRIQDLTLERSDYKVRITVSKTEKRTLLLPLSSRYLGAWLDLHPARTTPAAQVFPMKYHALYNQVARAGDLLHLKLTPHSLRHASATYWARHLSRYQLCYRMGWAMSSKQPDRYIDQEGLGEDVVREAVEADAVRRYSVENDELRRRLAMMEEQFNRFLKGDMEELKKIIEIVQQGGGAS